MNPIQSKIEQTAKEYLTYKSMVETLSESAKKEKETIYEKLEYLSQEDRFGHYFDTFASLEFLIKDMLTLKAKLYNQIEIIKEAVDVPKEITDLIADYSPTYTFAIIGDERKIIDENTYQQFRKNYIEGSKEMAKLGK